MSMRACGKGGDWPGGGGGADRSWLCPAGGWPGGGVPGAWGIPSGGGGGGGGCSRLGLEAALGRQELVLHPGEQVERLGCSRPAGVGSLGLGKHGSDNRARRKVRLGVARVGAKSGVLGSFGAPSAPGEPGESGSSKPTKPPGSLQRPRQALASRRSDKKSPDASEGRTR